MQIPIPPAPVVHRVCGEIKTADGNPPIAHFSCDTAATKTLVTPDFTWVLPVYAQALDETHSPGSYQLIVTPSVAEYPWTVYVSVSAEDDAAAKAADSDGADVFRKMELANGIAAYDWCQNATSESPGGDNFEFAATGKLYTFGFNLNNAGSCSQSVEADEQAALDSLTIAQ